MHLRSISLKGFKSFPDRTKLDFTPGVSVIVGPNGSGKSNITDAVLWALGEQSPLAVRGQTMKDVIFAGGHGNKGSTSAEVEVVIDNTEGVLDSDFAEISIVRRLSRDGDGEYRLNGARCRLVDVLEALSHLRPLKRQAEAAQLHQRIERQALEARLELARDDARAALAELAEAESRSSAARTRRGEAERLLAAVAERREAAEEAFAAQSRMREQLQARLFGTRSAGDRIGIRLERARDQAQAAAERRERRVEQLALLEEQLASGAGAAET